MATKAGRISVQRRKKFTQRWMLQHGCCYYCSWPMIDPKTLKTADERNRHPLLATWDHRLPASRGGGRGHNEVLACATCNHKKGSRSETEFRHDFARWLLARQIDAPPVPEPRRRKPIEPLPPDTPLDIDQIAALLAPDPATRVVLSSPPEIPLSVKWSEPNDPASWFPSRPSLSTRIRAFWRRLFTRFGLTARSK